MGFYTDRLAVVTGGGSGIGRELVLGLVREGCSVATCDLNEPAIRETAERANALAKNGARVSAHVCDVSDEASVDRIREEIQTTFSADAVHFLFNNAGIAGAGSFVADDRAAWERVFNVCWGGVYNCSRVFLPLLLKSEAAFIVNTSSANGYWAKHGDGVPGTAYGAAKFAVKGFSEALIEDLRTHAPHVRVAVVMPGSIRTGIGVNSAQILSQGNPSAGFDSRAHLMRMGLPVEHADDAEVDRVSAVMATVFEQCGFYIPAVDAAAIVLDGVRAGSWRIIVGDDARQLDEAVRADPECAYDAGGTSLFPRWMPLLIMFCAWVNHDAAAGLTGTVRLEFTDDTIEIRIGAGQVAVARGPSTSPDASLMLDLEAFRSLIEHRESISDAVRSGRVELRGDAAHVDRVFAAVELPRT